MERARRFLRNIPRFSAERSGDFCGTFQNFLRHVLTAEMMTYPFVDDAYQQMIMRFAKKQKYIFTRWTMFNLNKELQAKISQEVYS